MVPTNVANFVSMRELTTFLAIIPFKRGLLIKILWFLGRIFRDITLPPIFPISFFEIAAETVALIITTSGKLAMAS